MTVGESLAGLERSLAAAGPGSSLYLKPVGLVGGETAAALLEAGRALPLAGGPLAALACEVAARAGNRVQRFVTGAAELRAWAERGAAPAASRVALLLERIAAPRPGLANAPLLMGVVNITPDSFSDGGRYLDTGAALAHCKALATAGARAIDIGAESTRPGAAAVAAAEELARLRPVLDGLRAIRPDLPGVAISLDTRHASVMRAGLEAGIDMINDVTALTGDPESLPVAAGSVARIILMHMQGTPDTMNVAPRYRDVALDVFDFLEERIEACLAAGIGRERLIVDPGIGFGKRGRENLEVLRSLALFHGLGCPILVGVSRKGLGAGEQAIPPARRLPGSLAAAMHALSQGVQLLRVHDVAQTRQVVELWRGLFLRGAR